MMYAKLVSPTRAQLLARAIARAVIRTRAWCATTMATQVTHQFTGIAAKVNCSAYASVVLLKMIAKLVIIKYFPCAGSTFRPDSVEAHWTPSRAAPIRVQEPYLLAVSRRWLRIPVFAMLYRKVDTHALWQLVREIVLLAP